jgi:hypothetical protein
VSHNDNVSQEAFMNFSDFIRARGIEAVMAVTGASARQVQQWITRRDIPREHWPELLTAYPEVGLPMFRAMELNAKRQAA